MSCWEKSVIPIKDNQILVLFGLLKRSKPNFLMGEPLQELHSRVSRVCLMIYWPILKDRLFTWGVWLWLRALRIFCRILSVLVFITFIFFKSYWDRRSSLLLSSFNFKSELLLWDVRLNSHEHLFACSPIHLISLDNLKMIHDSAPHVVKMTIW